MKRFTVRRGISVAHRAEVARRRDAAQKLLDEVVNALTEMRRTMLGGGNRSQ